MEYPVQKRPAGFLPAPKPWMPQPVSPFHPTPIPANDPHPPVFPANDDHPPPKPGGGGGGGGFGKGPPKPPFHPKPKPFSGVGRIIGRYSPFIRAIQYAFEYYEAYSYLKVEGDLEINIPDGWWEYISSENCTAVAPAHGPTSYTNSCGFNALRTNAQWQVGLATPTIDVGWGYLARFYGEGTPWPLDPLNYTIRRKSRTYGTLKPNPRDPHPEMVRTGRIVFFPKWTWDTKLPVLEPWRMPVGRPTPPPAPLPWELIPYFPDSDTRVTGHEDPRPLPAPPGPPKTRSPRKPAEGKTRERKFKVGKFWIMLRDLGHATGEGLDLLEAFWNALPKEFQKTAANGAWRKPTPQEKLKTLWKHYKEIDGSDLVFELLWTHYGDQVIGRMYGGYDAMGNKAGVKWGPYGEPNSGPLLGKVKEELKARWDAGIDDFSQHLTETPNHDRLKPAVYEPLLRQQEW